MIASLFKTIIMKLVGIRYFLVEGQQLLFENVTDKNPNDVFIKILTDNEITNHRKGRYTFRLKREKNNYIGFFFKEAKTEVISLSEDDFNEEVIENWDRLLLSIDPVQQLILIQFKQSIASPKQVCNVIKKKCAEVLFNETGYALKLNFITDESAFWEIIDNSSGVFEIHFALMSPNLFGDKKKNANDFLKEVKNKYNNDEIGITFKNDNANLKFDRDEINDFKDYLEDGGGRWTLKVLDRNKKRKKNYKSSDSLKKVDMKLEDESQENIVAKLDDISSRLSSIYREISSFNIKE